MAKRKIVILKYMPEIEKNARREQSGMQGDNVLVGFTNDI